MYYVNFIIITHVRCKCILCMCVLSGELLWLCNNNYVVVSTLQIYRLQDVAISMIHQQMLMRDTKQMMILIITVIKKICQVGITVMKQHHHQVQTQSSVLFYLLLQLHFQLYFFQHVLLLHQRQHLQFNKIAITLSHQKQIFEAELMAGVAGQDIEGLKDLAVHTGIIN